MNTVLRSISSNAGYLSSSGALSWSLSVKIPSRLSSTVSFKKNKDFPPNSSIIPVSVNNRNPRNLEKLRIGDKPSGWTWEQPGKIFWNKVTFEITGRHINAKIVHYLGFIPVSASTTEWCIKKFLYSTNDTPAAEAVGTVLAHRCLLAGITEVSCFIPEEEKKKEKVSSFIKALEDGGLTLSEPEQFVIPHFLVWPTFPEKSWEVHEEIDEKLIKKLESIYKKS